MRPQCSKCRSPLANEINTIKVAGMPNARHVPNCVMDDERGWRRGWGGQGLAARGGIQWMEIWPCRLGRQRPLALIMPTPKRQGRRTDSQGGAAGHICSNLGFFNGWPTTCSLIVWGRSGADIASGGYRLIGVVCGGMCMSPIAWGERRISENVAWREGFFGSWPFPFAGATGSSRPFRCRIFSGDKSRDAGSCQVRLGAASSGSASSPRYRPPP